jgi:hypothetical protein
MLRSVRVECYERNSRAPQLPISGGRLLPGLPHDRSSRRASSAIGRPTSSAASTNTTQVGDCIATSAEYPTEATIATIASSATTRTQPPLSAGLPYLRIGYNVAIQLRNSCAPASPDFSGWNWVAHSGPFSTAATNGSPCSAQVTSGGVNVEEVSISQRRTA